MDTVQALDDDAASRPDEHPIGQAQSGAGGQSETSWRTAMPRTAITRLRRQLEALERDLVMKIVDERNRVQDEAQAQHESVGDLVDQAFVTTQMTMERGIIDRCMNQLDEIARTRDRIESGDIGICVDCHDPIEGERLQANPVASRCTECQILREKADWINAR